MRRGKSINGAADDGRDETEELVERKIAALNIGRIFNGDSLGRELRWAREALEDLQGESSALHRTRLQSHIEVAKAAMALAEASIGKMDEQDLFRCLSVLAEDNIDLPTSYKMQLWNRKSRKLAAATDPKEFEVFLDAIIPCRKIAKVDGDAADADGQPEFNSRDPKLRFIEGSMKERCQKFFDTFVEWIMASVTMGEAGKAIVRQKVAATIDYIEASLGEFEQDDNVDAAVNNILIILNALSAILDPCYAGTAEPLVQLDAAATSRDSTVKSSTMAALAKSIRAQEAYNIEKERFLKTYDEMKKHLPNIKLWRRIT